MRKIVVFLMILSLSIGTLRVFAQDATPTPPPAPSAQQSQQVSGVAYIGMDVSLRAENAMQANDYQQAIAEFSLFLLLNPTDSRNYFNRGLAYYELHDSNSALADLNRSLSLPPSSNEVKGSALGLRAEIYISQQQDDLALVDLNEAIKLVPSLIVLYSDRGLLYARRNQFQDALTDFDKMVELSPDTIDGYRLRALANLQLKQYDAALKDYNQLVTMIPDNPVLYAARAQINVQLKDYPSALNDLNQAITLDSRTGALHLLRGSVNNELGNQADAAVDYAQWISSLQAHLNRDLYLRPGESQVVQMQAGEVYLMSFQAQAGQKVTISASARPNQNTVPLLLLVDNSQPLVADDDSGGNSDALISDFVILADGVYGVYVGYGGGGMNGPVRVQLQISQ